MQVKEFLRNWPKLKETKEIKPPNTVFDPRLVPRPEKGP